MPDLREQLQASLGETCRIERELGGGGMSRVFLAEEVTLGRRVVVKVLPEELAGGVSVARFRREISLAARLQHPHIVPLLSASETDGLPYYTMPFVDGESLRARLARGELPVSDTISILRDVARALEYAHAKGVTHRDIKPDNVLLAGSSAVVTDFGVAKAINDAATNAGLTGTGIALGTPTYMAPEQAAADPATDHRADIYALGMMGYEMLAGHSPFVGRSAQATLAAHAAELPAPIAMLRPATPPRLADLITRCIAKRPGDRPQSATEILRELEMVGTPLEGTAAATGTVSAASRPRALRWSLAAAGVVVIAALSVGAWWRARASDAQAVTLRSIAVLPFDNQSGDTTFGYLEDGITDYVRDALNAVSGLTVRARSSSRRMKGRDAREVGSQIGVAAVLQGTVSGSRARLHVTAELVRTADDVALWSGTFDGQPNELVGMQDTIVRAVTARLGVTTKTSAAARASGGARGTTDREAYDLLLRGRYAFDRTDFVGAERLFREAVARDPRFARARALLAVAQAALPLMGIVSVDSIDAEVRRNAAAALAIDSTVVEAYVAESNALFNDGHFADAVPPLERALALDSNNVDVLSAYAQTAAWLGRMPQALTAIRRAHELDPLSVSALGIYGYTQFEMGRAAEGIANMRAAMELDPKEAIIHRGVGYALAFAGAPDSAVHELESAYKLDSATFGGRSNLIFGYAAAGRWADAARERALLDRERRGTSVHYEQAVAAIAFGDYDRAVAELERSVAGREPLLWVTSLPCDPLFDRLKSNARFLALLRRIGATVCAPLLRWPIATPAAAK